MLKRQVFLILQYSVCTKKPVGMCVTYYKFNICSSLYLFCSFLWVQKYDLYDMLVSCQVGKPVQTDLTDSSRSSLLGQVSYGC